jgi:hypothetical protein
MKIDSVLSQLDHLESIAFTGTTTQHPAFRPGDEGIIGILTASARNAYNAVAKPPEGQAAETYERGKAGLAAGIAKAFGDSGNLSNQDIQKALLALPDAPGFGFADPASFAKGLFQALRKSLLARRSEISGKTLPPETLGTPPSTPRSESADGWSVKEVTR